jgi:hypothetical protein
MSELSLAGVIILGGFICAFVLSECAVRRRGTSSRDRRRPYESELLPHESIPWQRRREEHQVRDADPMSSDQEP